MHDMCFKNIKSQVYVDPTLANSIYKFMLQRKIAVDKILSLVATISEIKEAPDNHRLWPAKLNVQQYSVFALAVLLIMIQHFCLDFC